MQQATKRQQRERGREGANNTNQGRLKQGEKGDDNAIVRMLTPACCSALLCCVCLLSIPLCYTSLLLQLLLFSILPFFFFHPMRPSSVSLLLLSALLLLSSVPLSSALLVKLGAHSESCFYENANKADKIGERKRGKQKKGNDLRVSQC